MVLTKEICPDVRFAYPEGAYTMLYKYVDGVPTMAWEFAPHTFDLTLQVLGYTDFVAYTVLPEHFTSEEY